MTKGQDDPEKSRLAVACRLHLLTVAPTLFASVVNLGGGSIGVS